MTKQEKLSSAEAVELYLNRIERGRLLSLTAGISFIRAKFPTCEMRDDELAELIASHAVARGVRALAFDLRVKPLNFERPIL